MNSLSCMTAYQPYFNKRTALSLGITGSGSGIGVILCSTILRFLFDHYTFSGAMLLYGKLVFECWQTIIPSYTWARFKFKESLKQIEFSFDFCFFFFDIIRRVRLFYSSYIRYVCNDSLQYLTLHWVT